MSLPQIAARMGASAEMLLSSYAAAVDEGSATLAVSRLGEDGCELSNQDSIATDRGLD